MGKKGKNAEFSSEIASRVFDFYRIIGVVIGDLPLDIQGRGGSYFVTAVVGQTFHVYDVETLNLLIVGPKFESRIISVVSHEDLTFVATDDGKVIVLDRAKVRSSFQLPDNQRVIKMQILGENILVLCEYSLLIFPFTLKKISRTISFEKRAATALHPHTYLNKILIGFSDGSLELWNFSTEKCIFKFESGNSSITSISQSPVVDVVAVGYENGQILLKDIKQDATLFNVQVKSSVSDITFRSDAESESRPQMAIGSKDGLISIWNLESKTLDATINAHESNVISLFFIPGRPVLISSGNDNSIKEWAFDNEEPRLLRSRSGHTVSPDVVKFIGPDGFTLISAGGAGDQSLRIDSLLKDSQSHELSQGSLENKAKKLQVPIVDLRLPPISDLAAFTTKELRWDNLLTSHQESKSARTWRADNKAIGKHSFTSSSTITAVAMSPCGNFGVIGNSTGGIDVYNMQSGQHRRSYQCDGSVSGLAIDQFARELISVTSNGNLTIFDFHQAKKILYTESLNFGISKFTFLADNGLAAFSGTDNIISIFDIEARRIVRRLSGHKAAVRDLSFSSDGKWIISCSSDKTIRTWDLPSGLILDTVAFKDCPKSISYSPTSEFLAATFENDLGIHLLSNRTIFSSIKLDHQQSYTLPKAIPNNIQQDIIAFSSQPRSKWLTLFHLDTVKSQSKPLLPDEGPKLAPFFLDAMIIKEEPTTKKRTSDDKIVENHEAQSLQLANLLSSSNQMVVLDYLLNIGASLVHLEISSLPEDVEVLECFLNFLIDRLSKKDNFELVQTFVNITLKFHQKFITNNLEKFCSVLEKLEETQNSIWTSLEALLNHSLCLTSFCRDRF